MNKQDKIDELVKKYNGKFPSVDELKSDRNIVVSSINHHGVMCFRYYGENFHISEFQQRARELGYVNGYRFGVEYPTNGEKPDLSDDVVINIKNQSYKDEWVDKTCWGRKVKNTGPWEGVTAFKITDDRYKPVPTGYLDGSAVKESLTDDWHDYTNQKALRLPPIGTECWYFDGAGAEPAKAFIVATHLNGKEAIFSEDCFESGQLFYGIKHTFKPLDHATRKAEAERKRVVDAAFTVFVEAYFSCAKQGLCALYDAGFLRMPEGK